MISFEQFKALAEKGNIIPVYKELIVDIDTPVSIFSVFAQKPNSFLLESVETNKNFGRYSIIGIEPFKILQYSSNEFKVIENDVKTIINQNPLDYLNEDLQKFKNVKDNNLPFLNCAIIGYFGFEVFAFIENFKFTNPDTLNIPDLYLAYCNKTLIFDHFKNKLFIVVNCVLDNKTDLFEQYKIAQNEVERLERKALQSKNIDYLSKNKYIKDLVLLNSEKKDEYKKIVNSAKKYIIDGDIFQCVLSQRLEVKVSVSAFEIYRALRIINPSPYMFYMNFNDFALLGSSPETMVRLRDNQVYLKPIAGTRPVVASEQATELYAKELMSDEKELAEHLMLLDLGRNDVGKISKAGTVKVEKQMYVERFAHVQHIVSDVVGELANENTTVSVFKATFPAGTVSGAPKIRAIEIINELEPIKRNFYAGAAGYITFSNEMDLAITIRSMVVKNNIAYLQAGAGIVFDSIDENEYKECSNKARSLLESIYLAETGIERCK